MLSKVKKQNCLKTEKKAEFSLLKVRRAFDFHIFHFFTLSISILIIFEHFDTCYNV